MGVSTQRFTMVNRLFFLTAMITFVSEVAEAGHVVDANTRYQIGCALASRRSVKSKPTFHRLLGISSDIGIKPASERITTVHGTVQRKFEESYKGLSVIGGSIDAEVDDHGIYQGGVVGGSLVLHIKDDVPNIYCKFSRTKAIKTVLLKESLKKSNIVDMTVLPRIIFVDDENKAHLTIVVEMLTDTGAVLGQPCYYIDMCNGEVIKRFNRIKSATTTMETEFTETTTEPYTTEETTTEPYTTEETTTELYTTEETTTELYTTEETTTEPYTTEETTTELYTTEETTTEPYTTEDTTTEPDTTEEPTTAPDTTEEPTTEPDTTEEPTTEPDTTEERRTAQPTTQTTTQISRTTVTSTLCSSTAVGVGGNLKTGKYIYGTSPRCLSPTEIGTRCYMKNEHVITVDLKQTKNDRNRNVIQFTCSSGYDDPVNGGYGPATDAFFFGTISQKMLKDWYKLTPLSIPAILVHYGYREDNAFWFNSAVMIGDGYTWFYPLSNLDTVAHELGHGVTETYSGLIYSGQSGGMNEAFSDIMGEAAEVFFNSTDWLSGFEDTKHPSRPLRYFDIPSRDGRSIDHASEYYSGLDVHYSSGVYNRAFYQIVRVGGVKMQYGFEAFITANRVYWNSNSNFVSGACGVIRAAYVLGLDTEKFKAGFSVVGVTTCDLTSYLRMLTTSQSQSNVKVSSIRHPVFGVSLTASASSITVTTTGGSGIKVAISTSLSRDSPLATGAGSVTWATGGTTGIVYVRLFTDSETEQTGVSVSLSMN